MTRLSYLIAGSTFETQYALAAAVQVNPSTLCQYISGHWDVLPAHDERLSAVLGSTSVTGWVELAVVT